MKALIETLFGVYTAVEMQQAIPVTSVDADGITHTTYDLITTTAPGLAGVDWPWIAGVCLFALVLFCALKIMGGILK